MSKTPGPTGPKGFKLLLSSDRYFLVTRALSFLLALIFALIYSTQLGVQRRGLCQLQGQKENCSYLPALLYINRP